LLSGLLSGLLSKWGKLLKVLPAIGLAVALLSGCSGTTAAQPAPTVTVTVTQEVPAPMDASQVIPAPVDAAPSIGVSDYGVTVKTTRKQCFGSAGCNVTIRLILNTSSKAQGVAAEVTVTVKGDESGPIIETISIDESGQYSPEEVSVSTKSSATKITAKVTDVLSGS
jgi:hypothetical protein